MLTITVNQGGTLDYAATNVTGAGKLDRWPNLVINQGTVTNTAAGSAHNYFGSQLTLNGGTLTGTGAGSSAAPQWNFDNRNTAGTVTVGTATPSLITGSGANDGLALTGTTTFYITGTGGLTVTVPLQNGNAGAYGVHSHRDRQWPAEPDGHNLVHRRHLCQRRHAGVEQRRPKQSGERAGPSP